VVRTAVRCALVGRPGRVSMIVAGRAERVLDAASGMGFLRIEEPFVLRSSRPFGDWRDYLPRNSGFM
jgi:hypothetical protein